MDGIDFLLAGIGMAIFSGVTLSYMKEAYIAKGEADRSIARFSALEKLLDAYSKNMQPKEFVDYARSLDLIDSPEQVDDSE